MKQPKSQIKPRNNRESLNTNQELNENNIFQKLMENNGITPLQKEYYPYRSNPEESESIEFQEDSNLSFVPDKSPWKQKYAGQNKPLQKKIISKRKILGDFRPDDRVNLHGETQNSVISKVNPFLQKAKRQGYQSVLIITGKGYNSKEEGGILRRIIWDWLGTQQNQTIAGFQWAPPFLGGKGAILVFLK